jgi:hypothetical protein
MHADLQRSVDELVTTSNAIFALAAPLSSTEFNWRSAPDRWSIGQCIDHLATTNGRMLPLLERAVAKSRAAGRFSDGPFRYGWISRWFLAETGPGGGRASAPSRYLPSLSELAPGPTLERYKNGLDRLVSAAHKADGLDLGRVRVPSAALPILRLPLGIWFLSLSAHGARHLNQGRAVRALPEFGTMG